MAVSLWRQLGVVAWGRAALQRDGVSSRVLTSGSAIDVDIVVPWPGLLGQSSLVVGLCVALFGMDGA